MEDQPQLLLLTHCMSLDESALAEQPSAEIKVLCWAPDVVTNLEAGDEIQRSVLGIISKAFSKALWVGHETD